MTTIETLAAPSPTDLETQVAAFAERLFRSGLAAFETASVALGRRLGLYEALTSHGPATPSALARVAGIDERYAREWLEQQAVAGLIEVTTEHTDPDRRVFGLSLAAQECLCRPESLASIGPLFDFYNAVGGVMPALERAYRSGEGVPYADYGVHDIQGNFNKPAFLNLLAAEWLSSIPGLAGRLAEPTARVAELGCGAGWAAIAIAEAWPQVRVDGYDLDEASVAAARQNAAVAGVGDRVRFELADVAETGAFGEGDGGYDLVLAFEMLHDLPRPVEALETMRRLGAPGATYLVVDERVEDSFAAPAENPMERFFYVASVLHCLPAGRTEPDSVATGAVMRAETLRGYAEAAGFGGVEVLPIEHDMFRFYRLEES